MSCLFPIVVEGGLSGPVIRRLTVRGLGGWIAFILAWVAVLFATTMSLSWGVSALQDPLRLWLHDGEMS